MASVWLNADAHLSPVNIYWDPLMYLSNNSKNLISAHSVPGMTCHTPFFKPAYLILIPPPWGMYCRCPAPCLLNSPFLPTQTFQLPTPSSCHSLSDHRGLLSLQGGGQEWQNWELHLGSLALEATCLTTMLHHLSKNKLDTWRLKPNQKCLPSFLAIEVRELCIMVV